MCFYNRLRTLLHQQDQVSLGEVSHLSNRDFSAHECQGFSPSATILRNLPLFSWGTFPRFGALKGIIPFIREGFSYRRSELSNLGISVWKRIPAGIWRISGSFSLGPVFPSVHRSSHLSSRRIQPFEIQKCSVWNLFLQLWTCWGLQVTWHQLALGPRARLDQPYDLYSHG